MLKLNHLLYLFIYLFLWACDRNGPAQQNMYVKSPAENLDRYCTYLDGIENFADSAYHTFYISRFNQLLQAKKIDSAAQVLFIAGRMIVNNAVFDSSFLYRSANFMDHYQAQIPDFHFTGLCIVMGVMYDQHYDVQKSTFYLDKATKIEAKDFQTFIKVADANYYQIYNYLNNGKYKQALQYAQQALQMYEQLKDSAAQATVYSGIACIYRFTEDYAAAELNENKAYQLVIGTKEERSIINVMQNKLTLYNTIEHKNLLPFIDSTFAFYQAMKEKYLVDSLSVYSWYAFKLAREKKLEEAKLVLDQITPILAEIGEDIAKNYYHNAYSEYDLRREKGPSNWSFYSTQIPIMLKEKNFLRARLYAEILVEGAITKKDYVNAVKYQELAQIANDSLTQKELRNTVKDLDKKYQTAKKEQQIHLQQAEIKKQNAFISLLFAVLLGILLSAIIYYLWQRQKHLQQAQKNSLDYTKQLLESTEEERRRIASDLHDSISHQLLNLKTTLTEDTAVVKTKIDSIINDIRGISRNLHPVMFDKIGLQPNLEQLAERMEQQQHFLVSTKIDYRGSLPSAAELQLYRIVQEALSNTFKYAKAHAAKITLQENPSGLFVEIRDNGQGFDVAKALNSGKAFGLHNIIERSRVIGGKAQVYSSNTGTIISITIPYTTAI